MDWFRTDSDLPRHPQVLRLARTLGVSKVEAIGHLTCLWCAVAEHAEDGVLDIADAELIELWAEWPAARAGHFVAAMQTVGWIDAKGMLKGWAERHEYMLRERTRKIEERRKWRDTKDKRRRTVRAPSEAECAQRPPDGALHRTVPDRTVPDVTTTTQVAAAATTRDPDRSTELMMAWNDLAGELHLPKVESLSKTRKSKAGARVRDGLLDRWGEVSTALRGSRFHLGDNDRGWKADFDWLCTADGWRKLVERARAGPAPARFAPSKTSSVLDELFPETANDGNGS